MADNDNIFTDPRYQDLEIELEVKIQGNTIPLKELLELKINDTVIISSTVHTVELWFRNHLFAQGELLLKNGQYAILITHIF